MHHINSTFNKNHPKNGLGGQVFGVIRLFEACPYRLPVPISVFAKGNIVPISIYIFKSYIKC